MIGSNIEMIGANAFDRHYALSALLFESGSRLREIGSEAFRLCTYLREFNMPESGEIIGDRCFHGCTEMETIEFEGSSRLKTIGELAFSGCPLHSITNPVLTEEIDGSAFCDCPLISIQVAPENVNFKIEGNRLVTSDGTELVK
jgi:hypothetical protein